MSSKHLYPLSLPLGFLKKKKIIFNSCFQKLIIKMSRGEEFLKVTKNLSIDNFLPT